jgi:hypothetical protein
MVIRRADDQRCSLKRHLAQSGAGGDRGGRWEILFPLRFRFRHDKAIDRNANGNLRGEQHHAADAKNLFLLPDRTCGDRGLPHGADETRRQRRIMETT